MSYHLNFKKLVDDLKGPKGVAVLSEEFNKIKVELEKLKNDVQPIAEKKFKQIEKQTSTVIVKLKKAVDDAEKKFHTIIAKRTKSAKAGGKKTAHKARAKKVRTVSAE